MEWHLVLLIAVATGALGAFVIVGRHSRRDQPDHDTEDFEPKTLAPVQRQDFGDSDDSETIRRFTEALKAHHAPAGLGQ